MNDSTINKIHFNKYKRYDNQDVEFKPGVTAIAGTNGTCKSSLLHIISNSYQECKKDIFDSSNDALKIITSLLTSTNPKLESLNRGDREFNDPAPGTKTYYEVYYNDGTITPFRKHNSKLNCRFRMIPNYKRGTHESLKEALISYLGINRLLPFSEFAEDDALSLVKKQLPEQYKQEIAELYNRLSGLDLTVKSMNSQKMGSIKKRLEFNTSKQGIDSNTISAGEDNLLIILTNLVCLHYFSDSLPEEKKFIPIYMLIDELDATLHPAYQTKLVNIFNDYFQNYKINIIFTTHSISLLEHMANSKMNIIYIKDEITSLNVDTAPDKYKIKQYLDSSTRRSIFKNRCIPIYSEDDEARVFIDVLFNYKKNIDIKFSRVLPYFYLPKIKCGCEILRQLFTDKILRESNRSICILDGDSKKENDFQYSIMNLPGKVSPETLAFEYALSLYENDLSFVNDFWTEAEDVSGITKQVFQLDIKPEIENFFKLEGRKGERREKAKYLFNKDEEYHSFFSLVLKAWILDPANTEQVDHFFDELQKLFFKNCDYHSVSQNIWPNNR